jgi:KUP system potassium uptake protein
VIASQALISGAFSATKQIVQLGYLPRLDTTPASGKLARPTFFINWALFVAIVRRW